LTLYRWVSVLVCEEMKNGGRDDGGRHSEVGECPQGVIADDGRGVWQFALDAMSLRLASNGVAWVMTNWS
jgi:hypothetical protein